MPLPSCFLFRGAPDPSRRNFLQRTPLTPPFPAGVSRDPQPVTFTLRAGVSVAPPSQDVPKLQNHPSNAHTEREHGKDHVVCDFLSQSSLSRLPPSRPHRGMFCIIYFHVMRAFWGSRGWLLCLSSVDNKSSDPGHEFLTRGIHA